MYSFSLTELTKNTLMCFLKTAHPAENTPEHGVPLNSRIVHGDSLMNFGIKIEPIGDYHSRIIKIEEI